jgi:hypothetical protein
VELDLGRFNISLAPGVAHHCVHQVLLQPHFSASVSLWKNL